MSLKGVPLVFCYMTRVNSQTKTCNDCGLVGDRSLFVGRFLYCKPCFKKFQKGKREQRKQRPLPTDLFVGDKRCSQCKQTKPKVAFAINRMAHSFLQSICKDCAKAYLSKLLNQRNSQAEVTCQTCKKTKPPAEFSRSRIGKCKPCAEKEFMKTKEPRKKRPLPEDVFVGVKECHVCKITQPKKQFPLYRTAPDFLSVTCKTCARKRFVESRKFLIRAKWERGGKCVLCGEDDLEVLEFDHIIRALKRAFVGRIFNKQRLEEELKLCQILCVACHNEKTARERWTGKPRSKKVQNNIDFINARKLEIGQCADCPRRVDPSNRFQWAAFHFDHNDGGRTKVKCISAMLSDSLEEIKAELEKTTLRCGPCHTKKTNREHNRLPYLREFLEELKREREQKNERLTKNALEA